MLFNSVEFLLGFLPLAVGGYFGLLKVFRPGVAIYFLALASVVFYGWFDWTLVFLLVGSVAVNYGLGRLLFAHNSRLVLALGVAFNLGLLGWFKYAGFFAGAINAATGSTWDPGDIVLPLAISFFTFQQIAFLVDVREGLAKEFNVGRYGLFVTFFPQLIAGPIVHHSEMLGQFADPKNLGFRIENLAVGLAMFTFGLGKKVLIADQLGEQVDLIFGWAEAGQPITFVTAWVGSAAFGLQIYFDFSGYSDMAIGLARIFGIRMPVNFASPYKARDIIDFWRRWHMTLSRFLRDYLYIPLGGGRRGPSRRHVNLMTTMLLGGLWHGAAWNFVLWGGLHGFYLMVNHGWRRLMAKAFPERRGPGLLGSLSGRALMLAGVILAWGVFRAGNWEATESLLAVMLGTDGIFLPESYRARFGELAPLLGMVGVRFGAMPDLTVFPTLTFLGQVIVLYVFVLVMPNTQTLMGDHQPVLGFEPGRQRGLGARWRWQPGMAGGVALGLLFSVSLFLVFTQRQNAFVYFQF